MRTLLSVLLCALFLPAVWGQVPDEPSDLSTELLDRTLEVLAPGDTRRLQLDQPRERYDDTGFPVTAAGTLQIERGAFGPQVTMEGDSDPYLLYAQYQNVQRDAVFLARTGAITDVLPSGDSFVIPYGYGALKQSVIAFSIVEAIVLPHVSDAQKRYAVFPVSDLYVGAGIGLSGLTAGLRYVYAESWVGYARVGYSFSRADTSYGGYALPIHVGAGLRFPSPLLFPFAGSNWTVGVDAMTLTAPRGTAPDQPAALFLPGLFLDVEHVLYDESGAQRDYRSDPRPYNYNAHSVVFRLGAYVDASSVGSGLFLPMFELTYQYSIVGPRIPEHEFNSTEVLYLDEFYVDTIREQQERRNERNQ
jgi:hypothetical protein